MLNLLVKLETPVKQERADAATLVKVIEEAEEMDNPTVFSQKDTCSSEFVQNLPKSKSEN